MALLMRCGGRYNVASSLDNMKSVSAKDWSK